MTLFSRLIMVLALGLVLSQSLETQAQVLMDQYTWQTTVRVIGNGAETCQKVVPTKDGGHSGGGRLYDKAVCTQIVALKQRINVLTGEILRDSSIEGAEISAAVATGEYSYLGTQQLESLRQFTRNLELDTNLEYWKANALKQEELAKTYKALADQEAKNAEIRIRELTDEINELKSQMGNKLH
jgi:hypothetical protein